MLFYVSLFVISLAISVGLVLAFRAFEDVGKSLYLTIFPGSRRAARRSKKASSGGPRLDIAGTEWDWPATEDSRRRPGRRTVTHPRRAPQTRMVKSRQTGPAVGWPYRDEPTDQAARERRASKTHETVRAHPPGSAKPWGW